MNAQASFENGIATGSALAVGVGGALMLAPATACLAAAGITLIGVKTFCRMSNVTAEVRHLQKKVKTKKILKTVEELTGEAEAQMTAENMAATAAATMGSVLPNIPDPE
jgi:hypothetical protein